MLKNIIIIIFLCLAAVMVYAATRPDTFRIERSIAIKAPPEVIYEHLHDFHRWELWSPWEKVDPAVKRSYSGTDHGVGAVYDWQGNSEVGQGRMQIVDAKTPSRLLIDIEFIKPFAARNKVEFTLVQNGDVTTVTQAMYGPNPYISKLVGLVFNSDKMVGDKYEEGLASLKAMTE